MFVVNFLRFHETGKIKMHEFSSMKDFGKLSIAIEIRRFLIAISLFRNNPGITTAEPIENYYYVCTWQNFDRNCGRVARLVHYYTVSACSLQLQIHSRISMGDRVGTNYGAKADISSPFPILEKMIQFDSLAPA